MLFYYRTGPGDWTQIEADSYRPSSQFGWYQTLIWRSGRTDFLPQGDTRPEAHYFPDGRCGGNGSRIFYRNQFGFSSCATLGGEGTEYLESITWSYIKCSIEFIKNGSSIKTVRGADVCPEVNGDPRNPGCEECCKELLPMMRSLHI